MEEWRAVVGWEGLYEVSSLGRVKSLPRTVTTRTRVEMRVQGRTPSPALAIGYPVVTLRQPGIKNRQYVHRLMAKAFLPNPHQYPLVRHLNDVRVDNRIENLAWGSHSDNSKDSVSNGGNANARKTHCPRGHEYTPSNTRVHEGLRFCRACGAFLAKGYRAARKEKVRSS